MALRQKTSQSLTPHSTTCIFAHSCLFLLSSSCMHNAHFILWLDFFHLTLDNKHFPFKVCILVNRQSNFGYCMIIKLSSYFVIFTLSSNFLLFVCFFFFFCYTSELSWASLCILHILFVVVVELLPLHEF